MFLVKETQHLQKKMLSQELVDLPKLFLFPTLFLAVCFGHSKAKILSGVLGFWGVSETGRDKLSLAPGQCHCPVRK